MQPFLIALQFLTIIPVRLKSAPTPEDIGRSLLWYPVVGLLIGLLLVLLHLLLNAAGTHQLLHAAILLTAWVAITGALHLDGLADTVDAWIGGHGDRERTLAIMKDPRSGPMAVVAVVLLLLLKFTGLVALVEAEHWQALLLAPLLGRSALLALFLTTPYVRAEGLGRSLSNWLPRSAGWFVLIASVLACGIPLWRGGLAMLACAGLLLGCLRRQLLQRLGGTTGDSAGTLLELTECVALLVGGSLSP